MSLYSKWDKMAYQIDNQSEYEKFWGDYLPKEAKFYEYLLENNTETLKSTVKGIADQFEVDSLTVIGFLDGINTSLATEIDMETLEEDTSVELESHFEKLYFNMHKAKANWLYTLKEWEPVLSEEKRSSIAKEYRTSTIFMREAKVGRNDPCPCGSGKKYKNCCGKNA